MENNENNIQNEVKNVENNVNSASNNKPKKGKTVALIIIIMILMLLIGLGAGYVLSDQKLFDNILGKNNQTQENNNQNKENKEEVKTGKKLDESKPWVYDAEYGNGKEEKKLKPEYSDEVYSTIDMIKIPYININSDDAKYVNDELNRLYDELYNSFGKNGEIVRESSYITYNRDNNLSIVLRIDSGVLNGGKTHEYKTYNFNLETLKKADMFEVAQKCGFKNKEDLNKAIDNSLSKAIKELKASENATKNNDLYYMNNNGEFYTMVLSASEMGYIDLKVDTSMIDMKNEETSTNQNTDKNENVSTNSYAEEYIKIIDEVAAEYPDSNLTCDLIYFNNDDIPDLVIGVSGYWVSLYVYENGTVYNPIDNWAYGAMGNTGYDYLEKKGAIFNYNSDYAGGIVTTSIAKYNSKHDFDYLAHRDKGADIDSTDSMYEEIQKDLKETAGYYYNDKKISEQEFNNKVKELSVSTDVRDYKTLDGSKTTEEVKNQLRK